MRMVVSYAPILGAVVGACFLVFQKTKPVGEPVGIEKTEIFESGAVEDTTKEPQPITERLDDSAQEPVAKGTDQDPVAAVPETLPQVLDYKKELSIEAVATRLPDETLAIIRSQPIDEAWAKETHQAITDYTKSVIQQTGGSVTMLECFSSNCAMEYYEGDNVSRSPGSIIGIAQAISELDGQVDLMPDGNNPKRRLLFLRFGESKQTLEFPGQ